MSEHGAMTVGPGEVVANPRVVEVVQPIIDFIKQQITERQVTYDEWHTAVQFMLRTAEAGELPLLMDAFFEATVDSVANVQSTASTSAIEGPYYVPGAPLVENPGDMPRRPDEPGEPLVFRGRVTSEDGPPLAGALLDIWHADAHIPGTYSNVHPGQPDFNLRGRVETDGEGRFEVRTIKPAPYPIPDQGPTGSLMNALGRHSWRPAHIHVKANAPGHRMLTTQIYFADGEFIDSDSCGAVKDELVVPLGKRELGGQECLVLENDLALAVL
jgi:catechol 1,2-dioxygenase